MRVVSPVVVVQMRRGAKGRQPLDPASRVFSLGDEGVAGVDADFESRVVDAFDERRERLRAAQGGGDVLERQNHVGLLGHGQQERDALFQRLVDVPVPRLARRARMDDGDPRPQGAEGAQGLNRFLDGRLPRMFICGGEGEPAPRSRLAQIGVKRRMERRRIEGEVR